MNITRPARCVAKRRLARPATLAAESDGSSCRSSKSRSFTKIMALFWPLPPKPSDAKVDSTAAPSSFSRSSSTSFTVARVCCVVAPSESETCVISTP